VSSSVAEPTERTWSTGGSILKEASERVQAVSDRYKGSAVDLAEEQAEGSETMVGVPQVTHIVAGSVIYLVCLAIFNRTFSPRPPDGGTQCSFSSSNSQ
jgi:hypothetical protein